MKQKITNILASLYLPLYILFIIFLFIKPVRLIGIIGIIVMLGGTCGVFCVIIHKDRQKKKKEELKK